MTYDPADKRALFQRVVDDIIDQIRDGKLRPGERLPSAKEISDNWDVSSMTAQRALRELQTTGLTYGMAGKGTYLHPEAPTRVEVLNGHAAPDSITEPITDPNLNTQLAEHLLLRDTLVNLTLQMFQTRDKTRRTQLTDEIHTLAAILDGQRKDLQPELQAYHAQLAHTAGKTTAGKTADTDEQPPTAQTPKRARRTPKT